MRDGCKQEERKQKNIELRIENIRREIERLEVFFQESRLYWQGETGALHQMYGQEIIEELQKSIKFCESYLEGTVCTGGEQERGNRLEEALPDDLFQ